jgi:hypothetical protein
MSNAGSANRRLFEAGAMTSVRIGPRAQPRGEETNMMTAMTATNRWGAQEEASRKALWLGRILTGISAAFLLFDASGKLLKVPPVVEAAVGLGFPVDVILGLGVTLAACMILLLVPRTAVLGALILTGYLGGAVAANVRIGNPFATHTLFPVCVATFVWGGLYLRDPRVRAMLAPPRAS